MDNHMFYVDEVVMKKGFTLVEMLIAVSILLLLMGGGIAAYLNFNERQSTVNAGRDLMLLMRAAQKKARSGDKPTGCDRLQSYSVVAPRYSSIVTLSAICANGSYSVETLTMPSGVSSQLPLSMQFAVLHGGVANAGDVRVGSSSLYYEFTVEDGGTISEGTLTP